MTSRVQTLRSSTKGARPTGRAVGELYTNFPDQQIGVVGPSGNIDLLAIRNFSQTADYAIGDLVARGGDIYRAAVVVTAGPWNGTQWTDIVHESDKHHGVTLFDPSKSYLQGELVAQSGNIYRAKSSVPAGPFNVALWDDVTTHGVSPFSVSTVYPQDALVANAGKIYRASAAVSAGPWNAAQWVDIAPPRIVTEALTITTANTIPPVANDPAAGMFLLIVNGMTFAPVGTPAPFTVAGKVATWASTVWSINPGDTVIAVYTTKG